ncbi:MAG: ABC transporter substrate-binding protein [Sedimentibacter sp.]
MNKLSKLIALILVASMTVVGCSTGKEAEVTPPAGEAPAAERVIKDTIKLAHWEEPATLDPQASNKLSYFLVEEQIFNYLIHEDNSGNYTPELATSWEYLDDTTIRFHLRDDVMFHNGEKLTAEDVRFTIARGCENPKSASIYKYFDAEGTTVVDDVTIDVKFNTPYAGALNVLASWRGAIVNKKAVEEMGEAEFGRAPIGTGPYKFVEWQSGTSINLTRNDEYYGNKAIVKNVEFKIIPEATNRVIELETGGVDVAYNVSSNDVTRIKENEDLNLLMGPSYRYTLLTFSMKSEKLQNEKLREALAYAIDKTSLIDAIYGDTAEVATGIYPKDVFGFKEFEPIPYDVEKAKALMVEAGYPDGIELKFVCEPIEEYTRTAEAIQNMWKQIGVTLDIHTVEKAAYLAQGNEFEVGLRAGNSNEPSNILVIYDSSFADLIQPNDTYIDEQLTKVASLVNPTERKAALSDLQEYIWNKHWTVPMAFTNVIYATTKNVENWEVHPLSLTNISDVTVYED